MKRTRLGEKAVKDWTGIMAATLSAEEEQVGLGSPCLCTSSFLRNTGLKTFEPRLYLEVFLALCALRVRAAASGGDGSAQWWICCEMVPSAERKYCIDLWRICCSGCS